MTSNIIFRCPHCGKMYKIVNCEQNKQIKDLLQSKIAYDNGELDAGIDYAYSPSTVHVCYLYTDFGDTFVVEMIKHDDKYIQGFIKCINCHNTALTSKRCMIEVEDWVADKIFTIKGS